MDMVARLPLGGRRWQRYAKTLRFAGVDLTGADMRLQIRLYRNAPGTPVIDLQTVTNGNAEGLRLISVDQVNGKPVSTVSLVVNETTMEGTPFMGETGDDSMFAYDLQITPPGDYKQVWLEGEFWVLAAVTGADAATPGGALGYSGSRPTRPFLGGGSSEFQIGDSVIQIEIGAPSGPKGDGALPSQRYDFTAGAGQSRIPANGSLLDNAGKSFAYGLNFATLIVNDKTIAPELYSYRGGDMPVTLAGGFVFSAGDKVTLIGQPYAIYQSVPGGGGTGEGVPLHSYPGTTVLEDPNRWDHSNKQLENAQNDTLNPASVNFGKWIDIYPFTGTGKRHLDEWTGPGADAIPQATDKVSGKPIPRRFLADNGDTLLDSWSQNGWYQVADFPKPHDVDKLPGNLRSGVRIRLLPGARVRRAPRYTGVSFPQDILRPLILACDPNPTAATTVGGIDTQSDVYNNIAIVCIGDSAFIGENHRWSYREHHNDISLNAATRFYIETNHYGTISDALYIGARNRGGGKFNAHNKNGTIHVVADGRNQNNRNVVSVIDCVGLRGTVRGYNYSRAGGQGNDPFNPNSGTLAPGIVDIEPNEFTDDPRIDDIVLDVYAEVSGASAVSTLLIDNNKVPHPLGSMKFTGKAVMCKHGKHTMIGAVDMATPYRITIEMDSEDCGSPFEVLAGQGATHRNGRNLRSFVAGLIGYPNFAAPQDYWRENEIDQELGSTDTAAIQVRGWNGGGIRGGQMINGRNKGYHLLSNPGTSPIRDLLIDGLEFINRDNIKSQSMQHAFYNDPSDGGAQVFSSTITERDVSYNGIPNERWAVSGSYVKSIPGFGIWAQGQEVYADPLLEPGAPRVMRTFKENTSGVPFWYQQEKLGPVPEPTIQLGAKTLETQPTNNTPRLTNMSAKVLSQYGVYDNSPVLLTATGANARWIGPANTFGTIFIFMPFSGSQTTYIGFSTSPNPTSFADIYFGLWAGDTTGGVLGKCRAVQSGGPAGIPANYKYGLNAAVSITTGQSGAVMIGGESGRDTVIYESGIPSVTLYPVILIGTPGEEVIIRGVYL